MQKLIIGTGGLAKELLTTFTDYAARQICFFDDYNTKIEKVFSNNFLVIESTSELENYIESIQSFYIAVANPVEREKLRKKYVKIGWDNPTIVASTASVSRWDVRINAGSIVLGSCSISTSVFVGVSNLINKQVILSHDVVTGDYCTISPGAKLLGGVHIGDYCEIGASATILPGVKLGAGCVVGAGSVVTKNFPPGSKIIGMPGKKMN